MRGSRWTPFVLLSLVAIVAPALAREPPPLPATLVWFEDWEADDYHRWTGDGYERSWSDCTTSGVSSDRSVSPPHSHRSRVFCRDDESHRGYGGLRFDGDRLVRSYRTESTGGLDSPHGVVNTFWVWLDCGYPLTPERWVSLLTVTDDCSNRWDRVITLNLDDRTGRLKPVHVDRVRYEAAAPPFPRRKWVRVTVLINPRQGRLHVWQDGRTLVHASFDRPSTQLCQWHWGLYASAANHDVELYEDDLSLWTLNEPWTDLSVEPRFGAAGRFPADPPALLPPVRSPVAAAPNRRPVIRVTGERGPAPWTVHAHGLESTLAAGDPLTARYLWDFGDPDAPFNHLEGFNAAHVYDRPGTYPLTLTIVDESGRRTSSTVPITIEARSRRPIYVSADGDDDADGRTQQTAVRTFARAARRLGDEGAILLRRGDVFAVTEPARIARRGWRLSAWGAGPRPELRWEGPVGRSAMLILDDRCRDALIEDVRFDSVHGGHDGRNIVDAIRIGGANVTVRHCVFGNVTTALNTELEPAGVLSLSNESADDASLRAYFVWGQGTDHVHLGNGVGGSRFEHVMRFAGAERVLLSGNRLGNSPKRTIWAMRGRHVAIVGNSLREGRLTVGPNHAAGDASDRQQWTLVTRNIIERSDPATAALEIEAGTEHVAVSNNIIRHPGNSAIRVQGRGAGGRTSEDVRVLCNTAACSGSGRFLDVGPGARDLVVCNNLFVAPELATGHRREAIVFVLDEDLSGFRALAHNCWPVPRRFEWMADAYHYVWPTWSDGRGYRSPDQWDMFPQTEREIYADVPLDDAYRPASWSAAVGHARPVPGVAVDFAGRPRPEHGRWTAGAIEVIGDESAVQGAHGRAGEEPER